MIEWEEIEVPGDRPRFVMAPIEARFSTETGDVWVPVETIHVLHDGTLEMKLQGCEIRLYMPMSDLAAFEGAAWRKAADVR